MLIPAAYDGPLASPYTHAWALEHTALFTPRLSTRPPQPSPQNSDEPNQRRPRFVWTAELHRDFVTAVNRLGVDQAGPRRILELMNVPVRSCPRLFAPVIAARGLRRAHNGSELFLFLVVGTSGVALPWDGCGLRGGRFPALSSRQTPRVGPCSIAQPSRRLTRSRDQCAPTPEPGRAWPSPPRPLTLRPAPQTPHNRASPERTSPRTFKNTARTSEECRRARLRVAAAPRFLHLS